MVDRYSENLPDPRGESATLLLQLVHLSFSLCSRNFQLLLYPGLALPQAQKPPKSKKNSLRTILPSRGALIGLHPTSAGTGRGYRRESSGQSPGPQTQPTQALHCEAFAEPTPFDRRGWGPQLSMASQSIRRLLHDTIQRPQGQRKIEKKKRADRRRRLPPGTRDGPHCPAGRPPCPSMGSRRKMRDLSGLGFV